MWRAVNWKFRAELLQNIWSRKLKIAAFSVPSLFLSGEHVEVSAPAPGGEQEAGGADKNSDHEERETAASQRTAISAFHTCHGLLGYTDTLTYLLRNQGEWWCTPVSHSTCLALCRSALCHWNSCPPIDVFCGIRHQAWQQEILKMLPPWTKKISQMLDQIESSGI